MCGIIGYVGKKKALPILIEGLKALEYRGYDSAGIAYLKNNTIEMVKSIGRISNLEEKVIETEDSYMGIGHTRWATHGKPTENNAHPHHVGKITLVHNGIIENYKELKEECLAKGYTFQSDTDTEVAAAMIDMVYREEKDMQKTLQKINKILEGSYALGILCEDDTDTLYAVRKDSPLIVGTSTTGNYIASDVPAIIKETKVYYLLEPNEIAEIKESEIHFYKEGKEIEKEKKEYEGDASVRDKMGYAHFMLKEMHEETDVIQNTLQAFPTFDASLTSYKKIQIVSCGSAFHAGLVAKSLFEKYAKVPVEVTIASEYRYAPFLTEKNTLVIGVSQSGETADTLAALKLAKENGIDTLGIVNVKESSIAREVDKVIYTVAGPEIAVATTKAYLAQVTTLSLLALSLAYEKDNITKEEYDTIMHDFSLLPTKVKELLNKNYKEIAEKIYQKEDIFYLGRGVDYALAMEGSLKLKEISYIHAEAYAAGELKHGTISLIEKGTPVISVITDTNLKEKIVSNNKEVHARGAYILVITNTDIPEESYDLKIELPEGNPFTNPVLAVVPMQMLGYEVALLRKCDIDKPKNLAKSVTVE
ncbi:MAG: glutamine--fructose-6-phosphate transaminase (isomerizing) [Bacilli bacterium]|nr:glutamine--fructose-6-phosphate transaminase (isomerizing) [Bacilli bacterium]